MRRQIVGFALLAIAIGLVGMMVARAQRRTPAIENRTAADKAVVVDYKVDDNYKLSGPYAHKNLAIFLIHGSDAGGRATGAAPLTLKEAMDQKKVVVHETGNVNQLSIENVSDEEVFVQSGDIVKGGKQDRVLAMDLIVPAKSGKIPIESFCVEQGRWTSRGNEAVAAFSSSEKMLNTKELKIAAKHGASQQEVWRNVAKSQDKMSAGVATLSAPAAPPAENAAAASGRAVQSPSGGGGQAAGNFSVASSASSSSLQLSLENERLKATAGDYLKQLSPIINDKSDAIGYAFAINGRINSADVYSSRALFKKLWPKLLEASVTEAISEFEPSATYKPATADEIKAFLTDAAAGKAEMRNLTPRVAAVKLETDKNLFFETRDRKRGDAWLHRNYIAK